MQLKDVKINYIIIINFNNLVNNVKLVRPEKAKAVEDMIIRNGMAGAIREKVNEDMLIQYLENFQDKPATTITFKRKVDDDDLDIDSFLEVEEEKNFIPNKIIPNESIGIIVNNTKEKKFELIFGSLFSSFVLMIFFNSFKPSFLILSSEDESSLSFLSATT